LEILEDLQVEESLEHQRRMEVETLRKKMNDMTEELE